MSVLSTGSNMNQFDYDKFGIIEGGKEMDAQFAFPYVHKALSAAQHALGQVQVGIVEYTISQGDDRKIKEQLGCAFYNMSDVQEGFAAIKQAIPELDSSEDLNAATKGVEEFDTCLTQISAQVAEIASQWLRVDPGGNESINEKLDMVKGYQKDLMRVHTQILYSKEIKQVRIGNLKDTIENTSSRTDSIILRWITKLSFVKAVLRKLFGWGAASPSIQQLEKHFKICKESLEGLKLASFDLHNKTELNRLVKSVETAKENLNEFSNYIYNIEGEEKKVKEFNSLIKEAKGEVDGLLTKLNQFKDDFGDQTFVDRMNSIHGEAQSFSPSSKAKSAASIISLCEQAMDQHQMNIDDDSFEEVLPMVVWAQGVLEKSLELGADQTTSAIKHSREEYLFLSMCLAWIIK